MRAAEAAAAANGAPLAALMERAGAGAAEAIAGAFEPAPTVVLCGPGGNGGDGLVVARKLKERGWPVRAVALRPSWPDDTPAALMARLLEEPVEPWSRDALAGARIVVDALFGIGLSRPLAGDAAEIVATANASGAPIVALDVPSGIDADAGRVAGAKNGGAAGVAVRAAATLVFGALKPLHLLFPARAFCGQTRIVDIGLSASHLAGVGPAVFANGPETWGRAFPRPSFATHKYDRGHAIIVSGPRWRTGAARLAARGALRAGAGLVTMASPLDAADENAAHLTAAMVALADSPAQLASLIVDRKARAVVVGPGGGVDSGTRAKAAAVLKSPAALIADADALTCSASAPQAFFDALRDGDVLTPHAGEFAKLFPDVRLDGGRLDAAIAAAQRCGATVVAKGADSVIGAGGEAMLFGGSGDDFVNGGNRNDEASGGIGNDSLIGGNGADTLFGGEDNDFINGGSGSDTLFGE
ncbi:MAG: NAD(P)H-hydrate epimerase, partial [Parvularculaceae bacterium]